MLYNKTQQVFRKQTSRRHQQKLKRIHRTNFQSKLSKSSSNNHSHQSIFDLQQFRERFLSYSATELEPVCQQIVIQQMPDTKLSPTTPSCPLICLFCDNFIYEPITLYCGHTYCEQCIKDKESSARMINCLRCSKDVQGQIQSPIVHARENLYSKNHFLKEILERIQTLNFKRETISLCRAAKNEYDNEKYEQAIKIYSDVLEKYNDDHTALFGRAKTYMALQQLEIALQDIDQVIRLKPRWAKGYYCRSQILFEMKKTTAALLSSLQGLSIDPDDPLGKQIMAQHLHAVLHDNNDDLNISDQTDSYVIQTNTDNTNESIASASTDLKQVMCKSTQSTSCLCAIFDCNYLSARDFECSICVNLLWFPVTTPCGHVFCRECLIRSIDNTQVQCPMCKSPLDEFFPMLIRSHVNQTEIISQMIESFFPNEFNERRQLLEQENNQGTTIPELLVPNMNNNESNIFEVPIFICVLALPYCPCPLHVFEPRYRLMMRRTMETQSRCFGMCQYDPDIQNFSEFGSLLYIRGLVYTRDGRSIVDTIGRRRFRVVDRGTKDGYCTARIQLIQDDTIDQNEFNELFELNRTTYHRVKSWFNQLDTYRRTLIIHQIEGYPALDDLVQDSPDGPTWTWVILNLLPIESNLQYVALASRSLRTRLQIINNTMDFLLNNPTPTTSTVDE